MQATQSLFGHPKAELEGANVSVLMPQPFSQRHNGYMARYVSGGEARILDSVREVVGLHRERYVFPLNLCVTKLSGVGTDRCAWVLPAVSFCALCHLVWRAQGNSNAPPGRDSWLAELRSWNATIPRFPQADPAPPQFTR